MFGPRKGTWWLKSETDPRWNCGGDGYVGGFVMPCECEQRLKELKREYGRPPKDLEWGYMKD
ncbi:MAG: hypothetical protein A3C93_02575 [Candidatus Lloydbacteria bacterium RIFCSPHIGHO2_02_FULL_54_17]|uniref:Uncharacterized protein n=1 Tax=Candidatus Lloydbacteria bacterium RIFCSPHIGHO2_02_FULL_54_17 TaxID=1798664 RepID=A0A1G2DDS8_9BACT|nr:MAG: hypothetical protein A2762_04325 [Candidatus Lloydbacteria bacterium RIFCSPHIGHO2_01_FULL_54_11]OGZ11794.1 MAG: hypothetical protein A3C93_02575 [Candidatus Lloydbacteria bacterium RIFCSPHIGHO2_02_FULL_54_17]OGZ14323.1 MAG: hypothetical protein A2948_01910 [Candidatus Lloydbacteria bacterium RIFCSPLOWO2_01_FULL_54_18]OGZ16009.1 MAG: hypothetical protein A3H76_00570 [Candidatus Lloydbacteria bacterium RIFCSPLOWO2_02_FULL_54_12]